MKNFLDIISKISLPDPSTVNVEEVNKLVKEMQSYKRIDTLLKNIPNSHAAIMNTNTVVDENSNHRPQNIPRYMP